MLEKFKLDKQTVVSFLPSRLLSLIPTIFIIADTANFGLGLLTYILCVLGSHYGWELGKKIHDYAPVTAIFGKSQSDLAWKKFLALHGSKITGFFLGLVLPWMIFDFAFNDKDDLSRGKLKNQQAGEISKTTDKILKNQYKAVENDILQYGDFTFKTGVQSAETNGGVYVVLRYEPKSKEYAKTFHNQFMPNILKKPFMQPLENGIIGRDCDFSGVSLYNLSEKNKLWGQETYNQKWAQSSVMGYYSEYKKTPAELLRKTILSLGIEPVYYLPLDIFSFNDFFELYKTYNDSHTGFEDDIFSFIFSGYRRLDSYGDNLEDYLQWRRYVSSVGEDGVTVYLHDGADYEHWYFEHNKASEDEYKTWLGKYIGVGKPTEYDIARKKLNTFVYENCGTNATAKDAEHYVPNPEYIKNYGLANNLDELEEEADGVPLLRVQYYKKFVQFVNDHWDDYPDGMKKHREYENLESYKKEDCGSFVGYIFGTENLYGWSDVEDLAEMRSAFAKENGVALQEEYTKLFTELYSTYKNVHIAERKELFKKLVDLSDCKVYIDYRCAAAADNWESASVILDKRGVLTYKLQLEPGKWVDAETYFTLRDNSKDFLQWK